MSILTTLNDEIIFETRLDAKLILFSAPNKKSTASGFSFGSAKLIIICRDNISSIVLPYVSGGRRGGNMPPPWGGLLYFEIFQV